MVLTNRRIKCKKCGALLPRDAKYCDACGEPCTSPEQKSFKKKSIIIMLVVVLIALLVALTVATQVRKKDNEMEEFRDRNSMADVKHKITAEEYQSLTLGTTMKDALEMLDGLGEHTYRSYASWMWPGKYYNDEFPYDSYAILSFGGEDSKLLEKEEWNIINEEQFQYFRNLSENEYEKIESPTVKLKQIMRVEEGMPYHEVASLMGGNGMLVRSMSRESVHDGTKKIERFVWKCKKNGKYTYVMISFENGNVLIVNDKDKLTGVE